MPTPTLRPAPTRWAAAAAVIVMAVGTVGAHHRSSPPSPVWVGVLLAVVAVLPALVDLAPAPALLISGASTAVYFAAGFADGPVFFAVPAVALAVTVGQPRTPWTWAGVAAALAVAGLWVRDLGGDAERPTPWQSVGLVALVAAAVAVAAAFRSGRAAADERTRSVASEERLRMAADLHDGVGHGLAVIAMQAGAALHVLDRDPASVRMNLEAIRDTSRESLDLLRGQLSRFAGDDVPRTPAPGLADLPALVDRVRSGGLDVVLTRTAGAVAEPVGRAAYAVVQEGLTNVLRHAAATRAAVRLERKSDGLVVTVEDDGRGPVTSAEGIGIAGMRARVEELGGTLEVGGGRTGFTLRARIPDGSAR